jgi:hypothetical protein
MKKSFLAVAIAAAFTTVTFAQPPMPMPSSPSHGSTAKNTHKSKKHKKGHKPTTTGMHK